MKNINTDPAKKRDAGANAGENTGSKGVYSDNEKSRNYKYGKDNPEGPNFDKKSKGADGDTGQNAGVFK